MLTQYPICCVYNVLLFYSGEFDVKHQIGIVWYARAGRSVRPIRLVRRYEKPTHATYFHAWDAVSPAFDDAIERERNRLTRIV